MKATDIVFDATTSAMGLTIVPDPNDPEEVALMGCAYAILMAYPDDQATAAKYIFAVYRVLGFGFLPPPWAVAGSIAELKSALMQNQTVMAAIRQAAPDIAELIVAAEGA